MITNLYFDESCHLDNGEPNIVFGALWCDKELVSEFSNAIKVLKARHKIASNLEVKWTKVSPAKVDFYKDIFDLFADSEGVNFRAIVVNRSIVNHKAYGSSEDELYYKNLYNLVRNVAEKTSGELKMYIDYKDPWSSVRSHKTAEYLHNTRTLRGRKFSAQAVRSDEVTGLQVADLLMGVVMYASRLPEERNSTAKSDLVLHAEARLKQNFTVSTPYGFEKFNIFHLRNPRLQ